MWHCEHKFAFDYYACIDEKGKQIASSKNKDDVINLNGKIVKKNITQDAPLTHKSRQRVNQKNQSSKTTLIFSLNPNQKNS